MQSAFHSNSQETPLQELWQGNDSVKTTDMLFAEKKSKFMQTPGIHSAEATMPSAS